MAKTKIPMTKKKEYEGLMHVSKPELQMLESLIVNYNSFLEIGTADGATAGYLASLNPDCWFLCIDLYNEKTHPASQSRMNKWRLNSSPNQNLFVGDVSDLIKLMPQFKFDIAWVDGDHHEDNCYSDICIAKDLSRGDILVHDYIRLVGVTRAVDRWLKDKPDWYIERQVDGLILLSHV